MEVHTPLTAFERRALWFLALVTLVFGGLTVYRSAFLSRRMGDAGMLFRAGWAARMGGDQLYTVTSDSQLHYHYPPLFAFLLAPFADPPPGAEPCLAPPYAVSVGIWYLVNVFFLFMAVHLLANLLESASLRPPPGSRRWWTLRVTPLLVCMPNIGETLNQGQVTTLLLFLVCAGFAASVRGRGVAAGLWLGTAIWVKIFPAFLVIAPLWRRDYRSLAGITLALVLGLLVLPALVYGPTRTIELYLQLEQVLIGPALGWGTDQSRADELFNTAIGPRSQSLTSAITSMMYPDLASRPLRAPAMARVLHWVLGAAMTLVTLWAFPPPRRPLSLPDRARYTSLFGGTLCLIMLLLCPVCHQHYLMLTLPLVMALVAVDRGTAAYPGWGLTLILAAHCATSALAYLPGLEMLKDKCLPTYGTLLVWLAACQAGRQLAGRMTRPRASSAPMPEAQAA